MLYLRVRVTRQHVIGLNRNDAMATSRHLIIDTKETFMPKLAI